MLDTVTATSRPVPEPTPLPRRAPLLLLLLASACAAPPPPVTVVTPPPPPPPPSASTDPPPPPAPPPLPPPFDPAPDTDALAIAKEVCPAAVKQDKDNVLVGCRACPPFSGKSAQPDGKVEVNPATFYPIQGVYRGAFTAPGADQRAVVFEGCEPHAANYGGTLLVDAVGPSTFKAVAYFSGVHPASCRPYRRPDGRDLLICRWSDAHQGTATEEVYAFDFAAAKEDDVAKGWQSLVVVKDTASSACYGLAPGLGLSQGRILGFTFEEHAGDRAPRILVELEHRFTPYSQAIAKTVEQKCKEAIAAGRDPAIDAPKVLGAPTKETVEFVFDGHGFSPTPRSRAILHGL